MAGALRPGTQLGEVELAARLEVSRGPVREALQRLVQEGILVAFRNRGVFVPRPTRDDVADVYLARAAVETAAAVAVMDRAAAGPGAAGLAAAGLDAAGRALASMESGEAGRQWQAVADLDTEFHRQLVSASGSARLQRAHGTLLVETRLCLAALEGAYRPPPGLAGAHRRLFEAVVRGDQREATRLIAEHMRDADHRIGALYLARAAGAAAGAAIVPPSPRPAAGVTAGTAASSGPGPDGEKPAEGGETVTSGDAVPAA